MQIFRRAFDKYQSNKHAFVLPLLFLIVLLYFFPFVAPIPRHYLPRDYRSAFSMFLYIKSSLDAVKQGTYEIANFVEYILLPTIMAVVAVVFVFLSYKKLYLSVGVIPFIVEMIVVAFEIIPYCTRDKISVLFSCIYLLFAFATIIFSLFLFMSAISIKIPQKEREPRPPRQHKPTKSERIAELERQVAELTKEKDTH